LPDPKYYDETILKGVFAPMKQKFLIIMAIVVSLALTIVSCAQPCPDMGKSAPEFTLQTANGENVNLSDFRGKKVILNFWATWCGPCQFETPFFQAIHNEQIDKGVVVLAIDINESASTVRNFANSQGITYPILLDTEAKIAQKYCIPNVLPITLFINAEGIIKARKVGAFRSQAEIKSILDSL
jgi:peroxiredoxin